VSSSTPGGSRYHAGVPAPLPPPVTTTVQPKWLSLLCGLMVLGLLGWIFTGRLLPAGLTFLLALVRLDPGLRIEALGFPDLSLLQRIGFGTRLLDQLVVALGIGGVLAFLTIPLGSQLRSAPQALRAAVLFLAFCGLFASELLLLPVISWAGDRMALALPVTQFIGHSVEYVRSGATLVYLAWKGVAWLCVIALIWPFRGELRLPAAARWLTLGGWWVTCWQTGQLMPAWTMQAPPSELRPWGVAHLASALADFPLMATMALLTGLLALPGILLILRTGQPLLPRLWYPEEQPVVPLRPFAWSGVLLLLVCGWVLLEPWLWVIRAGLSSVAYPDLAYLRYAPQYLKWGNYTALFSSAAWPDSGRLLPFQMTLGRALIEVALAWGLAITLARWHGLARGIPAFLLLIALCVGSVAPSTGLAYAATLQQWPAWPWPPGMGALPWIAWAFLVLLNAWPDRLKAAPVTPGGWAGHSPQYYWRVAFPLAFVALYLGQEPLLLAPFPEEPILWPTIAVSRVMLAVDADFPRRVVWLIGWHFPLCAAAWWLADHFIRWPGTVPQGVAGD